MNPKGIFLFLLLCASNVHASFEILHQCNGAREGLTYPHLEDCTKYYKCTKEELMPMNCGNNFWWDFKKRMCLPKSVARCIVSELPTTTTTTTTTTPEPTTTTPEPTTSQIWTTEAVTFPKLPDRPTITPKTPIVPTVPNKSPAKPTRPSNPRPTKPAPRPTLKPTEVSECPSMGVSTLSHPETCTKYIMCFDGISIVRDCAPGLSFNYGTSQCTFPELSDCDLYDEVCPLDNDPDNIVFIADRHDCSKYYYCYNGKPHPHTCASGMHWDSVNNWCAKAEEARCSVFRPYGPSKPFAFSRNIRCTNVQKDPYWIQHPSSCQHYFMCYDGTAILEKCDEGLYWDQEKQSCNFEKFIQCEK